LREQSGCRKSHKKNKRIHEASETLATMHEPESLHDYEHLLLW
jgi:hypothetical protein